MAASSKSDMSHKKAKNSKSRNDTAVRGTNDNSIVSKCSMCMLGYFQDDFLGHFVAKPARRAPLINRGYYIRAKAVDYVLKSFLSAHEGTKTQLVSLGAGFDSAYFRLKSEGLLVTTVFYEVDFPEVTQRKSDMIRGDELLLKLVGEDSRVVENGIVSPSYKLIGADLRKVNILQCLLEHHGIHPDCPTLLLSECVITYMGVKSSNAVIRWAAETFSNAVFVTYEQVYPTDGFGAVMQNHFKKLGTPLMNIQRYRTLDAQRQRYLDLGWTCVSATDMNHFHNTLIPREEKLRVDSIEVFDEFEEWHLKCSHYAVVCAFKGSTVSPLSETVFPDTKPTSSESLPSQDIQQQDMCLSWKNESFGSGSVKRFGHASADLTGGKIITFGGFGERGNQHTRLSLVQLLDVANGSCLPVEPVGKELGPLLFHTACAVSHNTVVVFGGRTSPYKPKGELLQLKVTPKLHPDTDQEASWLYDWESVPCTGDSPCPRWRHSTSLVSIEGKKYLLVFGGRTATDAVLGDTHVLSLDKLEWLQVHLSGNPPSPRHSHSCATWNDQVIIAGGLCENLQPSGAVHLATCTAEPQGQVTVTWAEVEVTPPLTPRYSHTSHVYGNSLILVGGVNPESNYPPGLTVVDMVSGMWKDYAFPECTLERPIMVHNHTSYLLSKDQLLIIGGGGNCFSFGTHLNNGPLTLDTSQCNL
ncbi:PREDICTED: tRNA wybutosine-synthesizing protein 4-like [Branchiostoma belcheri]|uniref:tRNA wybutosine-synthesizing protein 4 n=1 Tax=Branchiostoma belcheri TaxID=7741 RepID=A0A6P4ZKU5_BRABE|nr:PREDICTED: tRNA wybutosine-synthesizing protein 4-like [Branchiostoma belcheri]